MHGIHIADKHVADSSIQIGVMCMCNLQGYTRNEIRIAIALLWYA